MVNINMNHEEEIYGIINLDDTYEKMEEIEGLKIKLFSHQKTLLYRCMQLEIFKKIGIKNDPNSRRIIISGWNVGQLDKMALPPCHVLYQFYVEGDNLSVKMYQRSADVFLGLPFNIASTSALLYLFSTLTNKKPDRVIISIGDTHIYTDHINLIKEQIEKVPYELPKLIISNNERNNEEDNEEDNEEYNNNNLSMDFDEIINKYSYNDFVLKDYKSHQLLKAKMAV